MAENAESKKTIQTPKEKLYEAFKKHGIKRNNEAILKLREILGEELQKTTLEEVRKKAWRIR
jgi:ribosomal protein L20A (L18A)